MHRPMSPMHPVRTLVIAVAMALGLSLGAGQAAYAADPTRSRPATSPATASTSA